MRIATSQLYSRPTMQMGRLMAQADAAQTAISTTKRFSAPSGDAGAYLQLQTLKRGTADDAAFADNVKTARNVLEQVDTTLGHMETQLQRAMELTVQARTGTLSPANRAAIAENIDAIRDELFALANTSDARGHPLFAGAAGDTAYVRQEDGSIAYAGSADAAAAIPVANGDKIQATLPGTQIFGPAGEDMFAMLAGLSAALRSGDDVSAVSGEALDAINSKLNDVSATRAMAGARAARLELEQDRMSEIAINRETARSEIEDTDIAATVTELQRTLTVLQATQASFTKLTAMNLFDYLR